MIQKKILGRIFNHLEDLVFFYGSSGAKEAVSHLLEISSTEYNTVRFKWDGGSQVYWGRDEPNGPLVIATHNGWRKQIKSRSGRELYNFIMSTGVDSPSRSKFASQFSQLYSLLEYTTPASCDKFFYADVMYMDTPSCSNDVYKFSPNVKSKTQYHVHKHSCLGRNVGMSNFFLAGHAQFDHFGSCEQLQNPDVSFELFQPITGLIIHNPIYNQKKIEIDSHLLDQIQDVIEHSSAEVDAFLTSVPGLSDLKDIIYKYVNFAAKQQQLHTLSKDMLFSWIKTTTISVNKQSKLKSLDQVYPSAIDSICLLVKMIQNVKNIIIEQIERGPFAEIWDTNGEGWVRYADATKKFGHIKLVPRHRWTPQ